MNQPVTPTLFQLVALPFLLYIAGCATYILTMLNGRQSGTLPKRRWISVALILAGFLVAWGPAWDALNPDTGGIYRQMLTRKLMLIQITVPFVGLGLVLAVGILDVVTRKYIRSHYMD